MLKVTGAPADSKSEQQTQNKANHEHYSTKRAMVCKHMKLVNISYNYCANVDF